MPRFSDFDYYHKRYNLLRTFEETPINMSHKCVDIVTKRAKAFRIRCFDERSNSSKRLAPHLTSSLELAEMQIRYHRSCRQNIWAG